MDDRQLQAMLREADAASRPLTADPLLAARVRRRAARHTAGRAVAAVVLAAVCGVVLWRTRDAGSFNVARGPGPSVSVSKNPEPPVTAPAPPALAGADLARLRDESDEADLHERMAEMMLRDQRMRARFRSASSQPPVDPLEELRAARDRTAGIIVMRGDRLVRQFGDRAAATEAYRRVIELFPQSPVTAVASQRLDQLKARENVLIPRG